MPDPSERFKDYQCPKCRNHGFHTEEISLGESPVRLWKKGLDRRYLLVTCGLCGFTEMYCLNVMEQSTETAPSKQAVARIKEAGSS